MRNWAHWLTNLIHLSTNGWQYWTVGFPASFWFISCLILFDILFSKKTYLFKIQAVITCPITVAYIPNFSLQKEDAVIVDCNGGRWPVHSDLLRLRFPLFRHIEEIRSVVMSEASPGEVELLLGLTYGGDRFNCCSINCLTISESSPSIDEELISPFLHWVDGKTVTHLSCYRCIL